MFSATGMVSAGSELAHGVNSFGHDYPGPSILHQRFRDFNERRSPQKV